MVLTPASELIKKVQSVPPVFEDQERAFLHFAEEAVQQAIRSGARTLRTKQMALYVNAAWLDYVDTLGPFYEFHESVDFSGRTNALADRVRYPFELFEPGIAAVELGGYKVLSVQARIAQSTLEVAQSPSYQDYIVYVEIEFAPAQSAAE